MKLKKAMKLYPIQNYEHIYSLGDKHIVGWQDKWKLSPIQVAMKKDKSIYTSEDVQSHTLYKKDERRIWFNNTDGKWKGLPSDKDFGYNKFESEQEAVDWLLSEPEPFSKVEMLNKSGHTLHAGWHKCPVCGKRHN
jgi:hypothetical protein